MEKVQGQSIFQRTAYKTRQNTRARFLTHACVLSRSMCAIPLDHHLTTPSFQPVLYIVFYAPTFFYNHHKQRRKLCTLHNFRRCIMAFACPSQFSDPKGRRFESCQPHQKSTRLRYVGACFCCCMELAAARAALQPHHLPQLLLRFPLLFVKRMGISFQIHDASDGRDAGDGSDGTPPV